MDFKHLIWVICLFSSLPASSQMALAPSDEEDDDGMLTPEYIRLLTDSGRLDANVKSGFWKEFQFAAFMSSKRRDIRYDSMMHYDSTRRYLRFYKYEGTYIHGKREGDWKTFVCYKKRLPLKWSHESTVNYKAGLRQGLQTIFSKSGEVTGRVFFNDDLEDGLASFYYRAGELASKTYYRKGRPHGKSTFYKQNGDVLFEFTFREGERLGSVTYYGNGGAPYYEGTHDAFYEDGKLKSVSHYTQGQLDGPQKTFYPNGSPEKEMTFRDGGLDGNYKEFYDNHQLKYERIYKSGKLWEVIHAFSKKGKSLPAGTLKDGNGTVLTYNDNGKLLTAANYENGILQRDESDH